MKRSTLLFLHAAALLVVVLCGAAQGRGGDHLHVEPEAISFVPVCARHPYEIWIAPRRPAPTLAVLTTPELAALARAAQTALAIVR